MTSAVRQLHALLALRWQMAREPGVRLATVLGGVVLVWLLAQAARAGPAMDVALLATAIEVAPAAYLGFGALAVLAPLTSGGAQVVPSEQLHAYPVRPATHLLGSLLLAPLNLVWIAQLLALAALTSCLTLGGSLVRGSVTTAVYVVAVTVLGQLGAWLFLGLRQTRTGRKVTTVLVCVLAVAVVTAVRAGASDDLLARSPTHAVVDGVIAGGDGHLRQWAASTGSLLVLACAGLAVSWQVCRWSLRQPGDGAGTTSAAVRRRRLPATPLRLLVAVERASVWRAPAVRRGALVLALLPGLLASGAAVPWSSLVVLPGLVAAGAALLFGINAFALDGGGAVWLASLPHDPALALRAKAVVLLETVLGAVAAAALLGSLRTPGTPTAAELAALLSSAVLCTAVVVVLALRSSVVRPYAADLRGPRDAVAPPGALALASLRLALPTAGVGVVLGTAAASGTWWLPPALALPALALCGLSAARTAHRWGDPVHRSFVVHRVANG